MRGLTGLLRLVLGLLVIAGGLVLAARWLSAEAPEAVEADVTQYLSAQPGDERFARVTGPRPLDLAADAGPHPDYRTEWWYYTGNVATADGRRFGFQLTFFRSALVPGPPERRSDWAATQSYLAHFALTDVAKDRHHSAERLARGAAGLAGAQHAPFRAWVEDWSASAVSETPGHVRLVAADGPVAVDLTLRPTKPAARHGERGYSRKGPEPGNASYYYSFTRLDTAGTITTADGTFAVDGLAWMDHEWSTSALGPDQLGWDWLSLQLSDGRELMYFQIREAGGGVSAESSGSLIGRDGTVIALARADVTLEVTDSWTSPETGAPYPAGWRLAVPDDGLRLTLEPLVADQELDVGLRYWEGAVRVSGTAGDTPIDGYGYVELTGYAE